MMTDRMPAYRTAALLLDLDGTLLDIAASPHSVVVPDGLVDVLVTIRQQLDGALAVITGRPVHEIDTLLGDAPHAVAGEHGAALRRRVGAPIERLALRSPPSDWLERAAALAKMHPGILFERKPHGFGLHFRQAPGSGPSIHAVLSALVEGSVEFRLMPGNMLWEVVPCGADKGSALARLMCEPPFAGRVPVFIGDDVTDEDAIRAAREMGGAGLKVQDAFGDAAGVRAWLSATAARDDWGALA